MNKNNRTIFLDITLIIAVIALITGFFQSTPVSKISYRTDTITFTAEITDKYIKGDDGLRGERYYVTINQQEDIQISESSYLDKFEIGDIIWVNRIVTYDENNRVTDIRFELYTTEEYETIEETL